MILHSLLYHYRLRFLPVNRYSDGNHTVIVRYNFVVINIYYTVRYGLLFIDVPQAKAHVAEYRGVSFHAYIHGLTERHYSINVNIVFTTDLYSNIFINVFVRDVQKCSRPPGCMSEGAKKTGLIGLRFQLCSLHNVDDIRYPSSFF